MDPTPTHTRTDGLTFSLSHTHAHTDIVYKTEYTRYACTDTHTQLHSFMHTQTHTHTHTHKLIRSELANICQSLDQNMLAGFLFKYPEGQAF